MADTAAIAEEETLPAVVELLDRSIDLARRNQRPDLVDQLVAQRARLVDPVRTVSVIGAYKKGKSALVNALVGVRVCPTDLEADASIPIVVRHGDDPGAVALFGSSADDGEPPTRPITLAEVGRVAATPDLGKDGVATAIEVAAPQPLLSGGLVLVDRPPVHGGLRSPRGASLVLDVARSDAAVFVTDASQELTPDELDLLDQMSRSCPKVIGAMTKVDVYPQWRTILDLNQRHLQRAGLTVRVVPIASPVRHRARRTGDAGLDADSGIPAISEWMLEATAPDPAMEQIGHALVRSALAEIEGQLEAEKSALMDPTRVHGLADQLRLARANRERSRSAVWRQQLVDGMADLAVQLDSALSEQVRSILEEAARRIRRVKPVDAWPELSIWLCQEANQLVAEIDRRLVDGAQSVAQRVAMAFEADDAVPSPSSVLSLATGGSARSDRHEMRAAKFQRLSVGQLGIAVFRGFATGSMIGGTLGSAGTAAAMVVAPTVAGTLAVIGTPLTGALALVLGRKAFRNAREAQLAAHRTEALRIVQAYLQEVEVAVRKDARGRLRSAERQLREHLGRRADEVGAAAEQQLATTARFVQATKTERDQRLARLGAALAEVRSARRACDGSSPAARSHDEVAR